MSMFTQDVTIVVGDPLLQGKSIPELATISIMKYADTLVTAVYRVLHSGRCLYVYRRTSDDAVLWCLWCYDMKAALNYSRLLFQVLSKPIGTNDMALFVMDEYNEKDWLNLVGHEHLLQPIKRKPVNTLFGNLVTRKINI